MTIKELLSNKFILGKLNELGYVPKIEEVVQEYLEFLHLSPTRTPHRCPVCNGNGKVPSGFYNQTSGHWGSSTAMFEQCQSCSGTGVIIC